MRPTMHVGRISDPSDGTWAHRGPARQWRRASVGPTSALEVTHQARRQIQCVAAGSGSNSRVWWPSGYSITVALRRRQPSKVGERSRIIDDPILARHHQQGRLMDAAGRLGDQAVDDEAGGQSARPSLRAN